MEGIDIRIAGEADIPALESAVTPAVDRSFRTELDDQDRGVQSVFIASLSSRIVGSGFIRWLGPRDPQAFEIFPDAPEIFRLSVNENLRSRGIGSALISAMEREAAKRGYQRVSLGVGRDNVRAADFYKRLGFVKTEISDYCDEYKQQSDDGSVCTVRDICRFLVKEIASIGPSRVPPLAKVIVTSLCLLSAAVPKPSEAHHSASRFNQDTVVAIDGSVVAYEWRNPHVYLTVADAQGREWLIETDGTPILSRSGWTPSTFSTGDLVSARVHPSRTPGESHVLLVSVQTPDGIVLDSFNRAGRENDVAPAIASSLAGIWTSRRSQTFSFMRAWQEHPLTDKGRSALARYDPREGSAAECVPWPTPFLMTTNYWYLNGVELADDKVVIRSEFYDAERTIYLDGRGHPEGGPRTVQGHSIGRWEGDTLVVDTRLFADHPSPVSLIGIPSGAEKHVIERMTLGADGSTMLIDVYVEDPEYLAEPLSAQFTWIYAPQLTMISAPCDLEIAQRYLE